MKIKSNKYFDFNIKVTKAEKVWFVIEILILALISLPLIIHILRK